MRSMRMDPRNVPNPFLAARVTRCLKKLRNRFLQEPNFCFSKKKNSFTTKIHVRRILQTLWKIAKFKIVSVTMSLVYGPLGYPTKMFSFPSSPFSVRRKGRKRSSQRYCNAAMFQRCSQIIGVLLTWRLILPQGRQNGSEIVTKIVVYYSFSFLLSCFVFLSV